MAPLDEQMQRLIDCIFGAHLDPLDCGCEACDRELECLAEKVAAGAQVGELLPAVQAHLNCCGDCREEFEALVKIICAENRGQLAPKRE